MRTRKISEFFESLGLGSETVPDDMDFESDVSVDENDLETENSRQGQLVYNYGRVLAIADMAERKAYRKVKRVRGEVELSIRSDPTLAVPPLEKVTDNSVKAAVECHPDVEAAEDDYIRVRAIREAVQNGFDGVRDRKFQLNNLTNLALNCYYPDTKIPKADELSVKNSQNQQRERLKKSAEKSSAKLNRRK